ncbi:F-actin-capping protein subunit alpha-2-like [Carcharodon carcharias]|uniref:F-actin-capping protein subunit alpha-2-like n=1 Tax=Carcharodon carcharias TaxID=13397 RepID=UPI001B7E0244|nr:F-actin-capping protein subunit alpha-2-like [Carcharodon carcharias]
MADTQIWHQYVGENTYIGPLLVERIEERKCRRLKHLRLRSCQVCQTPNATETTDEMLCFCIRSKATKVHLQAANFTKLALEKADIMQMKLLALVQDTENPADSIVKKVNEIMKDINILNSILLQAPPGEFSEVVNDMRALLNDDELICENIERITAKYNLEQFIPVAVKEHKGKVLITEHGDLGNGYFLDPMQKVSFKFDHLNKNVSDIQPYELDISMESWRGAIESALTSYVEKHYPDGNCSVYGKTYGNQKVITACIESHKYQRNEFWNGFWKSEWKLVFSPPNAEVSGAIKVQAHYFEEGSINLTSNVDLKQNLSRKNECEGAAEFVKMVENADTEFQVAHGWCLYI